MRLILLLMVLLLCPLPLMAETYSWVDEHGTVNFTDDFSAVPKKFRKRVKRRDDGSPVQPVQNIKGERSETGGKVVKEADSMKAAGNDTISPEQLFGGKKASEWQREFRERDAELGRLDAKIKEVDEARKNAKVSGLEMVNLYNQQRDAVERYNESVKRYNALNDAANKAGVPAEFRK